MRVLLVNTSDPAYHLGLAKAARWWQAQGAMVDQAAQLPTLWLAEYDVVWISAIFSWHVPALIQMAREALAAGCQVEVGGPGTFGVRAFIHAETGLWPQSTPDPRFKRQPGAYRSCYR